jgi:hypothetical protein
MKGESAEGGGQKEARDPGAPGHVQQVDLALPPVCSRGVAGEGQEAAFPIQGHGVPASVLIGILPGKGKGFQGLQIPHPGRGIEHRQSPPGGVKG